MSHRTKMILLLALLYAIAWATGFSMGLKAHAEDLPLPIPPAATREECLYVANNHGEAIAYWRWKHLRSKEELDAMPYDEDVPQWMRQLIERWIVEAYEWKGSPGAFVKHMQDYCEGGT